MLPYEGNGTSKIMIVGDTVYGVDQRAGRFFQGEVGNTLDKLLREAGLERQDCILTTISRQAPPGDKLEFFFEDKKFRVPRQFFKEDLHELELLIQNQKPNIIIALGAVSMYYLTGAQGINSFRGYILDSTLVPGTKVLPTIHPATVNADWKLFFTAMMDIRKAARNSITPDFPSDSRNLETTLGIKGLLDYYDYLINDHQGYIAADIETVSPGSHINILGLADSKNHAVSVEFLDDRNQAKYDPLIETKLWAKLAQVLTTKTLVMQNGTYDAAVLWENNGIFCKNFLYDIMIAAHATWPECPRSLGFLASICLNVPAWKHTSKESPMFYNAADAANTYGIWQVMEVEMEKTGTRKIHDFEMRQWQVAVMLQLQGILIDRHRQAALILKHTDTAFELKTKIDSDIGRVINLNSPKQVAQLLYEEMALPKQFKRNKATGENTLTTGADALAVLCRLSDNPILSNIAKYKKETKLLTFLDCAVSPSNKVHTCYNITGANMAHETATGISDEDDSFKSFGRWSSSASIIKPYGSGNLQNIPPTAREMYFAGEGRIYIQADYKQAEAVVVAYLIQDLKLINLFKASFGLSDEECKRRNLDVHKITAAAMNGYSVNFVETEEGLVVQFSQEVSGDMRKVGKTIRHAKNYSAGPGVLARKLGISMIMAKRLMQVYDLANPELSVWQKAIQRELAETRILTNLFGRHHKFLDRFGDDLFRSSYSYKPQSSVGDLLNYALCELYERYASDEMKIELQLHDAIYISVPDKPEWITEGKRRLRECMIERVQPLKCNGQEFYIDIDFKTGYYWGDLHD